MSDPRRTIIVACHRKGWAVHSLDYARWRVDLGGGWRVHISAPIHGKAEGRTLTGRSSEDILRQVRSLPAVHREVAL